MKLVMYGEPFLERPGVIVDDAFILDLEREELEFPHSLEEILAFDLLHQVEDLLGGEMPDLTMTPLAETRIGPPLSGVGKIIACGLNYRDHAAEMGSALPANPLLFAKAASSITGPSDDIVLPPTRWSSEVDYEIELGVIIRHPCREVSVEDAPAYIAGYTIVNDLTARDIQRAESQWFRAKSYDGFCPIGPYLVTAPDIIDPQDLTLTTRVNGEVRQQGSTANMIFSVAEIVSFISHSMMLLPGDIIATGTPAGIGAGRIPPVFLHAGDLVELEISRLGSHRYRMLPAPDHR